MKFCTLELAHNSTVRNCWFKNIGIGHTTSYYQFNLLRVIMVESAIIPLHLSFEEARKLITDCPIHFNYLLCWNDVLCCAPAWGIRVAI